MKTDIPEDEQLQRALEVVSDPDKAIAALPPEVREAYEQAQQSVVDARRAAETHEGLLQVN